MRIEPLARRIFNEILDIADQLGLNVASAVLAEERGDTGDTGDTVTLYLTPKPSRAHWSSRLGDRANAPITASLPPVAAIRGLD